MMKLSLWNGQVPKPDRNLLLWVGPTWKVNR